MSAAVPRVGIIAALPGELAPLVKPSRSQGWTRVDAGGSIHQWERDAVQKDGRPAKWIAVCAGIGSEAATRAFAAAEKDRPLSAVLSVGWAGALNPEITPGQVLRACWVVNAQTGERFHFSPGGQSAAEVTGLVTTRRVSDADEKARLARAYPGAGLVDMEAATVGRLAAMRGISVYCFKGVSDGFGDRLPDLNPFIDDVGQFRRVKFAARVALQPRYWSGLRALGANSTMAAGELAARVRSFLEEEIGFDE
ncbi:MAG TPA: nucleoside phosphorylase [Acidisarcina sp.]